MDHLVSMNISQMKKLTSLTVIGSRGKYKYFTNEKKITSLTVVGSLDWNEYFSTEETDITYSN